MVPSALLAIVLTLFLAGPALAAAGTVSLASSTAAGVQADNGGSTTAISGDGRYVVFSSISTNLGNPPTANSQVFRKDLSTGALVLVSCTATGVQGNNACDFACLSYDGRYVAGPTRTRRFPWRRTREAP